MHNSVNVLKVTELHTEKMVKMSKFCVYFAIKKNKKEGKEEGEEEKKKGKKDEGRSGRGLATEQPQ